MNKHTDTERLDWLLVFMPDRDFNGSKYHVKWWRESYWHVAYGADWRECIDNAIDGIFERFN